MQIGDWRLRDQQEIEETPQLSCFNDTILESCVIDIGILDSIWEKAAQLAHTEGFVTPIPGEFGEKEKMVASSSSMQPHMVTVGRKNNNVFVCDCHCPRYTAYKLCPHTIAVAEINGCLKEFIKEIKKSKSCANMSKLAYHGLQGGAGEKGGKPKPKRRRYSSNVSDLPAEDRLAKRSKQPNVTSKVSHQQPVNLSAIGVDCSKQPVITPAQLSSSVEVTINPNQPLTLATHHTRSTSSITPPSSSNALL